ncbi:MAG TPA: hypothetical protein GX507_09530 [Clostridia bacterium]|nr:hypothetical protein [Clostridia bacterium]
MTETSSQDSGSFSIYELNAFKRSLLEQKEHFAQQLQDLGGSTIGGSTPFSGATASGAFALRDSIGELSTYDNHPADVGSETYDREKDAGLREQAGYILREIRSALEKIDYSIKVKTPMTQEGSTGGGGAVGGSERGDVGKGEKEAPASAADAHTPLQFGLCERCRKPIPKERLKAIPYARYCVACQAEEERRQRDGWLYRWGGRPVEETALYPPFGRTFTDETSQVGFDGEDAWQKVAQFGTAESPSDVPGSSGYGDIFVDSDEDVGVVEPVEELHSHPEVRKAPAPEGCCSKNRRKRSTRHDTKVRRKP